MQFLRCFSTPLATAELPLADRTADALLDVLLSQPGDQRRKRFIAALRESPSLTIWMLDRCRLNGKAMEVPTLDGLVECVDEDLPEALIDSLAEPALDTPLPPPPQAVSGDRAANSIAATATLDALEVSRRAVIWLEERSDGTQAVSSQDDHNVHQAQIIEVARCLGLLCTMDAFGQAGDAAYQSLSGRKADVIQGLIANLESVSGSLYRQPVVTAAAEAVYHGWTHWQMERAGAADPDRAYAELQREWVTCRSAFERLRRLATSLCRLERLEHDFSAALEEAKLQAMYKLAAGAGHEINNPLGSIAGRAQLLLRDESDPERRRTLAKINSQAFRAHEMIADMMLFARPPLPQLDQITPAALIQSLLDEMREMAQQQDAEMVSHVTTEISTLRIDASQLRVALRAMCTNALEATGLGGRVEILVSDGPQDDKILQHIDGNRGAPAIRTVQITVRDDGPGFSEEERQHLFDPFYSGREAGRGLGFGLSKCWRIVRNHGGRIDVQSDPGRGATFEITLPVA